MSMMDKRSPKATYWIIYGVTLMSLSVSMLIFLALADRWFGHRFKVGDYSGALAVPFAALSNIVATLACRRKGLSLESRDTKVMHRGSEPLLPDALSSYEIKSSAAVCLRFGAGLFALSLVLLFLYRIMSPAPDTKLISYLMAGDFAAAAISLWLSYRYQDKVTARVDSAGVYGHHGPAASFKTVPWQAIESCEVTTISDTLGHQAYESFIFKGSQGQVLLNMLTATLPITKAGQLKAAIQYHLSQP